MSTIKENQEIGPRRYRAYIKCRNGKKRPLFSFHQKPGYVPETNVNWVSTILQLK